MGRLSATRHQLHARRHWRAVAHQKQSSRFARFAVATVQIQRFDSAVICEHAHQCFALFSAFRDKGLIFSIHADNPKKSTRPSAMPAAMKMAHSMRFDGMV
jgi:hypothetical protein